MRHIIANSMVMLDYTKHPIIVLIKFRPGMEVRKILSWWEWRAIMIVIVRIEDTDTFIRILKIGF